MSTRSFTKRSVAALAGGLLAASTVVAGAAIARTAPQAASPDVQGITERPTLVGSITDPVGDVKSSAFSPAVLASVDVKSTKVYSGLDRADHEVVIETQLAGAVKSAKVARAWTATLTWRDAEGAPHKAVVRFARSAQNATSHSLLVDGEPVNCNTFFGGPSGGKFYTAIAGECLSDTPEPYRVVVNTVATSGKSRIADATKISTLKPTPAPALRSWTWDEKPNDATGSNPTDFSGASEIVDAKLLGGYGKATRVEATLVDAAFYPWDVAQTYTLNVTTNENGAATHSFSGQAPRTGEAGTFTLAGSGDLKDCAATAATTRTEKLTITLPTDCTALPRVASIQLVVDAAGEDGSKAKANDSTNASGPVLLR